MAALLRTALGVNGKRIWRAFDRASREPEEAQARLLADILRANRKTVYGQRHGFAQIKGTADYAGNVPVVTFDDITPYVARMKKGERSILTAEQPILFNVTSGTTSEPKYVPFTQKGLDATATRARLWLYRALRDHPKSLDHSIVCISCPAVEGRTPAGIPYGSASGMMYRSLPRALHGSFALPFVLSDIADPELRYYLFARMAMAAEPSFVVTPNPATLIRMAEIGMRYQEDIVRSVRDGVISLGAPFKAGLADARIVTAVNRRLRPDPRKARFLEGVICEHGKLFPHACWKKLRLIGCWLGGSIGYQADGLVPYFGRTAPRRDIGYLASEGAMTIPCRDNTPAGILALHNNFYEFLPAKTDNVSETQPLACHEVEVGRPYRILLTNRNGLYRYDIHDIVEVHGFYNRTPVIAFVRKGDDMLSIAGEKLHVNHLIAAFGRLCERTGICTTRFRAVPDYEAMRHELLVHFETPQEPGRVRQALLPIVDRALSDSNMEYAAKRATGRLNAPCIHVMDDEWSEDVRRSCATSRAGDAQYKWRAMAPCMSAVDARHVCFSVTL